jgi:hypothetical protein
VSVRYVELADYLAISAEITGLDTPTLIRVTKVDLAESALHAPAAGFGETEFYPDFIDKATVLVVRLAKNHPLPDGNKRAAWLHYACSSRSTTGHGTPCRPLTTPSEQCSPSPPAPGIKTTRALGYGDTLHQRQLAQHRSTRPHAVGYSDRRCHLTEASRSSLI